MWPISNRFMPVHTLASFTVLIFISFQAIQAEEVQAEEAPQVNAELLALKAKITRLEKTNQALKKTNSLLSLRLKEKQKSGDRLIKQAQEQAQELKAENNKLVGRNFELQSQLVDAQHVEQALQKLEKSYQLLKRKWRMIREDEKARVMNIFATLNDQKDAAAPSSQSVSLIE